MDSYFSKYIHKEFVDLNLGYQGILGFFILSLISMITIFFLNMDIFIIYLFTQLD